MQVGEDIAEDAEGFSRENYDLTKAGASIIGNF